MFLFVFAGRSPLLHSVKQQKSEGRKLDDNLRHSTQIYSLGPIINAINYRRGTDRGEAENRGATNPSLRKITPKPRPHYRGEREETQICIDEIPTEDRNPILSWNRHRSPLHYPPKFEWNSESMRRIHPRRAQNRGILPEALLSPHPTDTLCPWGPTN